MKRLALLIALLSVCQSAFGQSPTCYRLNYDSIAPGLSRSNLAFTIRLTPRAGKVGSVATLDTAAVWRMGASGSYQPYTSSDSMHVYLSNGQWELWFDFGRQGDRLVGWVSYNGDVQPAPSLRAHVTAVPFPCTEP